MIFFRISRQIPEESDVCRCSIKFAKTNSKIAEIFEIYENCENLNYSILSNFIQSCPKSESESSRERCCPGSSLPSAGGHPLVTKSFAKIWRARSRLYQNISKRNFARKYAFDSIFQALQDLHTYAPLQSQNLKKSV